MVLFPHAKINLGLNVVRKRHDGYHDIESVLIPISLRDALEAIVDPDVPAGKVQFTRTGLLIPSDSSNDLVMKAHAALQADYALPGLRMHLHKVIPTGAGLGGGSSDAVHALLLLDKLLEMRIPESTLRDMAAGIGSDCPFFLNNRAQLAEARGEKLRPLAIDLSGYWLMLVNPGLHISTPEVFANTTPTGESSNLAYALAETPMRGWRLVARNVMEDFVFAAYPEVQVIRDRMLAMGAEHAAMSGSGSTVFGLFLEAPPAQKWPSDYRQWVFQLGE
ncbi:MAG: 4-(cytidine 5'-diphospho)-2-C-methyl-D-erythritol kinase [Flavobacteriales bacterium]|nr:4-(cytidine 5'-diphospho)-2-C-methyl-D-erythritol kinase [Flavobacteriales bacterium]